MPLLPRPALATAAFAATLVLAAGGASAQAFDAVRLYGAAPGQDGGIAGAAVIFGRAYPGSDERRTRLLPALDYQWANGWFAGTSNGLGYNFSATPGIAYGLRLTADLGRKEHRSPALAGLGDIDARPEFGGFFNYSFSREFTLTSSLRYGAGDERDGVLLDLGAVYSLPLSAQWRLSVGGGATYANASYLQSWFGITPAQSARSGYAVYEPGAGLRDVRGNVSLSYGWSPRVTVTTGVSVSSLQGDAKDSPVVRQRTGVTGLAVVSYAF